MRSLRRAIRHNQRFCKYEKTLRRIRLRVFQYEDDDRLEKAKRIIERIKVICGPTWRKAGKAAGKQDAQPLDILAKDWTNGSSRYGRANRTHHR